MNTKLKIVMYHYVREIKDSRYPGIKGLEKEDFIKQIDFLMENYQIVTMEQVVDAIEGKKELPEKAVLLTFDDGYADHYTTVLPILAARNIQGSFFIPVKTVAENKLLNVNKVHFILATGSIDEIVEDIFAYLDEYRAKGYDIEANEVLFEKLAVANRFDNKETIFVKRLLQHALEDELSDMIATRLFEKYVGVDEVAFAKELHLSKEQIRHMKQVGMYIGMHGYEHHWLGKISDSKMEEDVRLCKEFLEEFIDEGYSVMNYPYGSYNEATIKYIQQIGCKAALATEVGIADIKADNIFALRRLDTNDLPPKSDNYLRYQ